MKASEAERKIAILCANTIKQICTSHALCEGCPLRGNGECVVAPGRASRAPMNWDIEEKK